MALSFAVRATSETVTLKKEPEKPSTGTAQFTVTNTTASSLRGRARVVALGEAKEEWFSIEPGHREGTYAANETVTVPVKITVPATVAGGTYSFRLDAFSEEDPEEDYTEGQSVTMEVGKAEEKKPFPWWIVYVAGGVIVLALIIWGIIALISNGGDEVRVPDVTGLPFTNAATALQRVGLSHRIVASDLPEDTSLWIVASQEPREGETVEKDSPVALTIEQKIQVPDIVGEPEARGRDMLRALGLVAVKEGEKNIGNASGGTIIEVQPPVGGEVEKNDTVRYFVKADVQVDEDCISFRTDRVRLEREGTRVLMTDGRSRMKMFPNMEEARKAFEIIKRYNLNSQCFVGRPNPPAQYWLSDGNAPRGSFPGEDCIRFNPDNLTTPRVGDNFVLSDGGHRIISFPNRDEAQKMRKIIQKHGFDRICFVGRPNSSMMYFRR